MYKRQPPDCEPCKRGRGRPKLGVDADGNRIIGKYRDSERPDWVWPEHWARLSRKKKDEAIAEDAARKGPPREGERFELAAGRGQETDAPKPPRIIVELCASPDSKLGELCPPDCNFARFTEEDDLTHKYTIDRAMRKVTQGDVLVWISIPCVGGTPWQNLNQNLPGFHKRMRKHKELHDALWESCTQIATEAMKWGGSVVLEWPTNCRYWNCLLYTSPSPRD